MTKKYDVLLAGYYGFGNLGDELLARSATGLLRQAGIAPERIAILSAEPRNTSEELGLTAFNRWDFFEVYRALQSSRTLLLGGGGLFQDSTSVRSCLYYWGLVRAAGFCSARPWAVGQSIGPLRSAFARYLTKNAFASCVYRGVRDVKSLEQLQSWGIEGNLAPDLVMGVSVKRGNGQGSGMLLNLRPGYDKLAENAARQAQKYAAENGIAITGIAFSREDEDILRSYAAKNIVDLGKIALVKDVIDFENEAAGSVYAVGMRLHFLILSLLSGRLVCAVPYDPKVNSLALSYNIPMVTEDFVGVRFSDGSYNNGSQGEAATLLQVFSAGARAALGES